MFYSTMFYSTMFYSTMFYNNLYGKSELEIGGAENMRKVHEEVKSYANKVFWLFSAVN